MGRIAGLLVVVCAACGGDDGGEGTRADASARADAAGPADAAAAGDGGSADAAPPGPVVVRLQDAGVPRPGVAILLHDPGGAVLAEAVTGDTGEASFDDPPAGAMVSALVASDDTPQLQVFTVVGVEAGDTIVIGDDAPGEAPTSDVEVHYPGAVDGADTYLADLGCDAFGQGDADAVITRAVSDSCRSPQGVYDALATARQGTTPLAFAVARNVEPADPTAIFLPAWTAATSRRLSIFNPPLEATATDLELRPVLAGTVRSPAIDEEGTFAVPTSGQVDGWNLLAQVRAFTGSDARIWAWRQALPSALADPYDLDFADFGPRIDAVDMDSADPVRPQISWQTSGSVSGLGAMVLVASWSDPATEPPATHRWTLVTPPGTAAVVVPALPDSAAAYRPSATAETWVFQVYGLWYARHGGYAGFRNDRPFALGPAFFDPRTDEARMIFLQVGAGIERSGGQGSSAPQPPASQSQPDSPQVCTISPVR